MLLAAACGASGTPEIYPGLFGGASVASSLAAVKIDQSQTEVIEDTQNPPTDPRPKYHLQEIYIPGAHCLGASCRLHLVFFNDELVNVVLYSRHLGELKQSIRWAGQFSRTGGNLQEEFASRGIKFVEGDSPRFGPFMAFGDAYRLESLRKWIERYS